MVAYSYKKRFVAPIRIGLGIQVHHEPGDAHVYRPKLQTIRADRKRHARPGEEIQHYCGMRTKHCFLIGRSRCMAVETILMKIGANADMQIRIAGKNLSDRQAEECATNDGFGSIEDMWLFWREEHKDISRFSGVLIRWVPNLETGFR